jgi:hypothetical protein
MLLVPLSYSQRKTIDVVVTRGEDGYGNRPLPGWAANRRPTSNRQRFPIEKFAPMSSRRLLRRHITDAWHQSITTDYAAQRINSERSLQASVWANLNARLPTKTRRMFIEPRMSVPGSVKQSRFPDIVICNTYKVIGIIELKYQPRVKPSWAKDLATFHWITEKRKYITVSNVRFRGIGVDSRSYPLAENVLYVWAGVHAACELDLTAYVAPAVSSCFLELHAETRRGEAACIRSGV